MTRNMQTYCKLDAWCRPRDHNDELVYHLLSFAHYHYLKVFVDLFLFAVHLSVKVTKQKKCSVWAGIFSQVLVTHTRWHEVRRKLQNKQRNKGTSGKQMLQCKTLCNKTCPQNKILDYEASKQLLKFSLSSIKKNKPNKRDKAIFSNC